MILMIVSHSWIPAGVMKYTLRAPPCNWPMTRLFPEYSFLSCSRRLTRRAACERDTPRTSATPSWVISLGAPTSMDGDMCRYLYRCSSARLESVSLFMDVCCFSENKS